MPPTTTRTQWRSGFIPSGEGFNQTAPLPRSRYGEMQPITQGGGEAFARSLGRSLVPGAAWAVDRPQAGYPTDTANKLGGSLPYGLGALWTAIASGRRAEALQGIPMLPEQLPGGESWMDRGLAGLDPLVSHLPIGSAAKMGYSAGRGLMGAPGVFGTSWEQTLAGMTGAGARAGFEGMPYARMSPAQVSEEPSPEAAGGNFAQQRPEGFDFTQERVG